ncbi:MAG: glucosaminidase domain-containing protein [Verrucomicrobia bacterium]|nr:glucosaminidase domain-containing protein [Verrucomicrobiota bacterium]
MPQVVDLTSAIARKTFAKKPKFRLGLVGTLVVSNFAWLVLFGVAVVSLIGVTRFSAALSKSYLEEKWNSLQNRLAQKKEIEERDMRIARLIASQSSDTTDILGLATRISKILDSANGRQRRFLENAIPEAMLIQTSSQIPASAVLAMAIFESGYGNSMLAKDYNNYFGMKAFNSWTGPRALNMPTRDSGEDTTADFRAYPNLASGFQGYSQFLLSNDRYRKHVGEKSGIKFVSNILAAGYCPDPDYLTHIRAIIQKHGLDRLDAALEEIVDKQESVAKVVPVNKTPAPAATH